MCKLDKRYFIIIDFTQTVQVFSTLFQSPVTCVASFDGVECDAVIVVGLQNGGVRVCDMQSG